MDLTVYRVNWLRAKARLDRWQEEERLLREEMIWTVATFQYHENRWFVRAEQMRGKNGMEGHVSFALQQRSMWKNFATKAETAFRRIKEE
jgi:hypothetical protein